MVVTYCWGRILVTEYQVLWIVSSFSELCERQCFETWSSSISISNERYIGYFDLKNILVWTVVQASIGHVTLLRGSVCRRTDNDFRRLWTDVRPSTLVSRRCSKCLRHIHFFSRIRYEIRSYAHNQKNLELHNAEASPVVFFIAEMSVRSPRKLNIFII